MRVRFFTPTDEQETAAHLALESRIAEFWQNASRVLSEHPPSAFERDLTAAVGSIDPRLSVVCDGSLRSGLALTITPGESSAADPVARAVVDSAPPLPGAAAVRRFRPPMSWIEAREMPGYDWSLVQVRAGVSRGHLLELVLYSHEFTSEGDERALDCCHEVVARLLGHEAFDTWVGGVAVAAGRRPSSLRVLASGSEENRFPLAELPSAVSAAIAGIQSELAPAPAHVYCERAEWVMFELNPTAARDYREQDDLALCTTMLPEMMKSYLQALRFSSVRFSKHGEHYCYLKVDAEGIAPDDRIDRRTELEDALNFALVPGRVGCVVGTGIGVRYLYVVLALADLEHGIRLATRAARRESVPPRSWLLFCDDIWKDEWVGVWDATPAPP